MISMLTAKNGNSSRCPRILQGAPVSGDGSIGDKAGGKPPRPDGKIELQESDCYDKLGFGFSNWKKWTILSVIFAVQTSMNFNTSVYASVIDPLTVQFNISKQAARVGQMIFLVAYAFEVNYGLPGVRNSDDGQFCSSVCFL
jgi:hypothetical protein